MEEKKQEKKANNEVNEAAAIHKPGSAAENKTGSWRTSRPVLTDKCSGCGICAWYCPDNCIKIITKNGRKQAVIDYDYCKGCMICVAECPNKAIRPEKECGKQ